MIIEPSFSKGQSITLKGHTGAVRSVRFSNDSRHLLTSSDDKSAKVSTTLIADCNFIV
jgi:WD40 repeat protein